MKIFYTKDVLHGWRLAVSDDQGIVQTHIRLNDEVVRKMREELNEAADAGAPWKRTHY